MFSLLRYLQLADCFLTETSPMRFATDLLIPLHTTNPGFLFSHMLPLLGAVVSPSESSPAESQVFCICLSFLYSYSPSQVCSWTEQLNNHHVTKFQSIVLDMKLLSQMIPLVNILIDMANKPQRSYITQQSTIDIWPFLILKNLNHIFIISNSISKFKHYFNFYLFKVMLNIFP